MYTPTPEKAREGPRRQRLRCAHARPRVAASWATYAGHRAIFAAAKVEPHSHARVGPVLGHASAATSVASLRSLPCSKCYFVCVILRCGAPSNPSNNLAGSHTLPLYYVQRYASSAPACGWSGPRRIANAAFSLLTPVTLPIDIGRHQWRGRTGRLARQTAKAAQRILQRSSSHPRKKRRSGTRRRGARSRRAAQVA